MTTNGAPTWDLESIFPGGSRSVEFGRFREEIREKLASAASLLSQLVSAQGQKDFGGWARFVLELQTLYDYLRQASSFVGCLVSQNVDDEEAHRLDAEISALIAEWSSLLTGLEEFSTKLSDSEWAAFIEAEGMPAVEFFLNKLRDDARAKMAPELERLVLSLAVDGYHAWHRLYDKMAGDLRVEFEEGGKKEVISLGQLAEKSRSPDREVRRQAFDKLNDAWRSRADLAAMALNAQAGFRLAVYKGRNWKSPLEEPLRINRMKRETLDAMWSVVGQAGSRLKPYVEAKKRLLGIDKFKWYDQTAPVGKAGRNYTFREATEFIVSNLAGFSAEVANFSKRAIEGRWVEAENRPGKAGGAFCTGFPLKKQSRIFMTFAGTFGNVLTLAHELGHAYHSFVLLDKPSFAARYPMTLAETASTFNELQITDAALASSDDPEEKLALLDQKLSEALTMLCNIYARYLFDMAFYEERKKGFIPRTRLEEMMTQAQKEAYGDLLENDGWHSLFWASKQHFFITSVPFYHFPYTFGYLFGNGIYDRALKEGSSFAKNYRQLLSDSGCMTTEQVAARHLGVDLTKSDFWNDAVERVLADVGDFVRLAEQAKSR